jgi:purine-binding chemotaxis protein CheW
MSDPAPRQLVVFALGREEYALPISHVHEIIRYTEPRFVASREEWTRGVISLRGKIIPVHDLAVRLGVEVSDRQEGAGKIVIVESGAEMVGVIVDEVEEVVLLEAEQIGSAPGSNDGAVSGVGKLGERLIVLLEPAALFGSETAAELAEAP